MNEKELKFSDEFLSEFKDDAEFNTIKTMLDNGMNPYKAIEILCRNKKVLFDEYLNCLKNQPHKVIVSAEKLEELKKINE